MRFHKRAYCELQFLTDCFSKMRNNTMTFNNIKEIILCKNIIDFLIGENVKLVLNISIEEYKAKLSSLTTYYNDIKTVRNIERVNTLDELLLEIEIRQHMGKLQLHLDNSYSNINEIKFDSEQDKKLNSYFFTNESYESCEKLIKEYGVLVISSHDLNRYSTFLSDRGTAIKKQSKNSWKNILHNRILPCNSITIVDNYILAHEERINENLKNILIATLPEKLNVIFQINILTSLKNGDNDISIESRYSMIKKIIKNIRPNLEHEITIIKCNQNLFHDRTILTNSTIITCGGGFDLFNRFGTSTKHTTISVVYPYFSDTVKWSNKNMSIILEEINKLKDNLTEYNGNNTLRNIFLGDNNNRLLFN